MHPWTLSARLGKEGKEGKQSSNVAIKKKVEEYAPKMVPLVPLVP